MNFNFKNLDKKTQLILASSVGIVLSAFLPWVNILKQSISAWQAFEQYGNLFAALGMIAGGVAIFLVIKEKIQFAFYATIISLLVGLNWYFLWTGEFNVDRTEKAMMFWRQSLTTGFYMHTICALISSLLLAERLGYLNKLIKKKDNTNSDITKTTQSVANQASKTADELKKKVSTLKFTKKQKITSIIVICVVLLAFLYIRFFHTSAYNSYDYISNLANEYNQVPYDSRKVFYEELQNREHKIELSDLYVYGVMKNFDSKKRDDIYSENPNKSTPMPLYTIYCAPTKKTENGDVVAHCFDFGVPANILEDYHFRTNQIAPVNRRGDVFGNGDFIIAINVYDENLIKGLSLTPPVFVHESLYPLETLKELGLEEANKLLGLAVSENSATPKNWDNPRGNRSWITNFFTKKITAVVSHPNWVTNEDGSPTYNENDEPFRLYTNNDEGGSNFLVLDLIEISEVENAESKQRKAFEQFYKMDYEEYSRSLLTCLNEMRNSSVTYDNYPFNSTNGELTGDVFEPIPLRIYTPIKGMSHSPVGDPYFNNTCPNYINCFEQIAPITVKRKDFEGVIENKKYKTGKAFSPLNDAKVNSIFFTALNIIAPEIDAQSSIQGFISNGYTLYRDGKPEKVVFLSSTGEEFSVSLDINGNISEVSGSYYTLFSAQKTPNDAYVMILTPDGRSFKYDPLTNSLIDGAIEGDENTTNEEISIEKF